jgi:hypothetical protein
LRFKIAVRSEPFKALQSTVKLVLYAGFPDPERYAETVRVRERRES